MNRYEDAARKVAPTTAETLTLLERLRPDVYANGQCELCSHDDDEKLRIADTVLRWWHEANIDGFVDDDGNALVPSEDGQAFVPRPLGTKEHP
jgi:hypothetical protein